MSLKPTSKVSGFSMIELMVVLTVMGIMLGVAVPNFLRIGRRDAVEAAAYDLQRTLALARQKALAKRQPYRLTVEPSSHTYYVERRENGSWVSDPPETFDWCSDIDLFLSVGGSASNTDIELEPQGTVLSSDAPALFTFANAHGDTMVVSLVRTGRIRVRS